MDIVLFRDIFLFFLRIAACYKQWHAVCCCIRFKEQGRGRKDVKDEQGSPWVSGGMDVTDYSFSRNEMRRGLYSTLQRGMLAKMRVTNEEWMELKRLRRSMLSAMP